MAITRYRPLLARMDPWVEFDALRNRLASYMREPGLITDAGSSFGWNPTVDVTEDEEALVLTAELPGIEEKDVNVQIENNVLSVSGEKKREHEEKDEQRHVWEREYGMFERRIALPKTIAEDRITADFDKGVLTVRMPKLKEAKGRKIEIKGK